MNDSQTVRRIQPAEFRWVILAASIVALLSLLPYVVVALTTPAGMQFGGALVNPVDGQSYLAKMRQGYDGAWLFRLPFTAGDEPDAFLFTYHLALGHLARITGLPLTVTYHAARVAGGWVMLVVLYGYVARLFAPVVERRRAWIFAALTSGLGWLGWPATDLTIPESNTFFSILANAHFALATALILIVFMAVLDGSWRRAVPASLGLAILQPFAPIAVFAGVLVNWMIGWWLRRERWRLVLVRQAKLALIVGASLAPLLLYFYLVTQSDPILRGWSAQNQTPSPPPLEWVVGYGIAGVLALAGVRLALRRRRDVDVLTIAWVLSSVVLLYAPIPLQRRFSLGLHTPVIGLGAMGLGLLFDVSRCGWRSRWLPRLAFVLSLPSTILLLVVTSTAALRPPDARLFFTSDEAAAFEWLRAKAGHDSVVLSSPEIGLYLPAWADVRVVYGHPFETLAAEATRSKIEGFFARRVDRDTLIREWQVDYVFFGPRENQLGWPDTNWPVVFRAGDVAIYQPP